MELIPISDDELPQPEFVLLPILRGLPDALPVLRLLLEKKAFVCGGYARYCASPIDGPRKLSKAGDLDIYCEDEETFNGLYQHFKDAGLEIRRDSDVAITYKKPKDVSNLYYACPAIQLIKPIREGAIVANGSMEDILRNFDFTVIRCGIVYLDGEFQVLADRDFLKDEEKKFLRIKNIHCPISSLLRFMKYGRKGYSTKPSQLAKLFADWDARSDEYRERLLELFADATEKGDLTPEEIDELEALMRID